MYSGANALNTYQQNSVNTASKEKLLLMLFDGLIKFIRQGISGIEEHQSSLCQIPLKCHIPYNIHHTAFYKPQ
jgi:flagellar biosynthetic protein FliS